MSDDVRRAPALALDGRGDLEPALRGLGVKLRASEVRKLLERLERAPTRAELALLDSMWSEHCSYKSTRALLGRLPTTGPQVVLGPGADAGVVRLPRRDASGRLHFEGARRCIAIGHESHNHPSQLLPFEGASTGIGGIVRDVYCMGAEVVGVLDALRFGDPDGEQGETVRQIARGVVDGIAHYGNALGVPNLGGEIAYDAAFDDNCLVNVVALGTLVEDELVPSRVPEAAAREPYVLLLVGKPTDDSGLGGAAFASGVLDTDEDTQERGAVQLPDPFFKRVLTEANREALAHLRRGGKPFAMKDLGAAGLGGAASEIASPLGCDLDLDAVHTDRPDRPAAVLLVAETQERYVLAIPAAAADALVRIYEAEFELGSMVRGAGARVVGRVTTTGRFRVFREEQLEVDLPVAWITEPETLEWERRPAKVPARDGSALHAELGRRDLHADVRQLLGSPAGCARRPVYAHFDSDVQGRTLHRPGDADAGVIVPWHDEPFGVAVAVAGPARLGRGQAWRAAAASVCAAVRGVVATGATPWALTDCLNFGSPENPHGMQDLDDAVRGLCDAARALGVRGLPGTPLPYVSGNVSLYNESRSGKAIPPTPIVACLGVLLDFAAARSLSLERAGDSLYHVGVASEALGGSVYAQATEQLRILESDSLPELDLEREREQDFAVLDAFDAGIVRACHGVGKGGILLALVRMACGRSGTPERGARCVLPSATQQPIAALFSESPGFVCEIRAADAARFEALCASRRVSVRRLGEVLAAPKLQIDAAPQSWELPLPELAAIWMHALDRVLSAEGTA